MFGRLFTLLTVLTAIGLFSSTAWAQQYTVINLGTLGGNNSDARAVNDAGQVAGESTLHNENKTRPFRYSNGTMLDLGGLGGDSNDADGINNKGHVAGATSTPDGHVHAYLWDGTLHRLDPPGQEDSGGEAINATDQVLGWCCYEGTDPVPSAVIFTGGTIEGVPFPLGIYNGLSEKGINNSGQLVGDCWYDGKVETLSRGCVITGTTVKALKALSGYSYSQASAIDEAGDACGESVKANNHTLATLWVGTSTISLGQPPTGDDSQCLSWNDFSQGAGFASAATHSVGVLFDLINGARDLNELIEPTPHLVVQQANQISNTGYIAAQCTYSGHPRACLLKPNSVLILKKNIFQLSEGDPECIQCKTVLNPEGDSLPETLAGLSATQRKHVAATVDRIVVELDRLERAGDVSTPKAVLLLHQAQLVLDALNVR